MTTDAALRRTPLYEEHKRLGARMVPFAGYEMPIQYTGIVAEHRAVREDAGVFDLSHMGEFYFEGREAQAAVDKLVSSDVAGLEVGEARYGLLCNEGGTIVDDVIVYESPDQILRSQAATSRGEKPSAVPPRASASRKLQRWPHRVQGPRAAVSSATLSGNSVVLCLLRRESTRRRRGRLSLAPGTRVRLFEIFVASADAPRVWQAHSAGRSRRVLDRSVTGARPLRSRRASRCTERHRWTTGPIGPAWVDLQSRQNSSDAQDR